MNTMIWKQAALALALSAASGLALAHNGEAHGHESYATQSFNAESGPSQWAVGESAEARQAQSNGADAYAPKNTKGSGAMTWGPSDRTNASASHPGGAGSEPTPGSTPQ